MILNAKIVGGIAVLFAASFAMPVVAQDKKSEAKKVAEPAKGEATKAKAEKVAGDIGLLDTDKNYMIVVTKDGKLVTLDYNTKTKVSELRDTKVKMADVGLGASAQVEYVTKGDKNVLTKMLFIPAKGE